MNRKYGVIGSRPYRPEPLYHLTAPTTVDHMDRMTLGIPIRDQGDEGSCTGHGWARVEQAILDPKTTLSTAFPYFLGRVPLGMQLQDSGAMVGDVGDQILKYGIATEETCPYKAGDYASEPTYEAFADAMVVKNRVKHRRLFGSEQVKSALAGGSLVVLGFAVPEYFESSQMATDGWLPLPASNARFIGGHCVACDGFDARVAQPFAWIANSWGADWALKGYFKLPLSWFDDPRRLVDEVYAVSRT